MKAVIDRGKFVRWGNDVACPGHANRVKAARLTKVQPRSRRQLELVECIEAKVVIDPRIIEG
jgi:hypothetical protein